MTTAGLRRICALYAIEARIRSQPPDGHWRMRLAEALPLFDDPKQWFGQTLSSFSAKSDTTRAIRYALTH